MSWKQRPAATLAELFARPGSLLIVGGRWEQAAASIQPQAGQSQAGRPPDVYIAVLNDGAVWAFNGHVDLGTGVRTALAQIVAEELDVPLAQLFVVLGDTEWTPNQGGTLASETIQVAAVPLRRAAAQARRHLVQLAAEKFGVTSAGLAVRDGVIAVRSDPARATTYGELIGDRIRIQTLAEDVALKPRSEYRVIGSSAGRVDLPAKATGGEVFVHDVRIDGMLHGRVVRPPYVGRDSGPFVGNSLIHVDEPSIAHIPGIVAVVIIRDFVGIVAEREEHAAQAAAELKIEWREVPTMPDLNRPERALRDNPSNPRIVADTGDVDERLAELSQRMRRSYVWPYQMHASIGPCCSVADFREGKLTLWSGTQTQQFLRADLARLLEIPESVIEIIRLEASGCYGRNSMDDVGADAALLSRAVGFPVRVQLTREQEHGWEPKGAAQLMDIDGGLDEGGEAVAYDFHTRYPSNLAPVLALLLTGKVKAESATVDLGDRTAVPPYAYRSLRVTVHDMPAIARAAWLRGVSALPSTFAHESYIDELATAAGVDPIEYRLRYLHDERGVALVQAVAERAGWGPHTGPTQEVVSEDVVRGRGFAYAVYVHGKFPGTAAAWSAWVADVEVNKATGELKVIRIIVGQDSGSLINPAGVIHQVHGNVIQSVSRTLMEQVLFDQQSVVSRDWGSYPILKMNELPAIDVVLVPRPADPPLGVGESTSLPSAAAIANAVFDATGVRFRELPLTPERIREGLEKPKRKEKSSSWRISVGFALSSAFAVMMAAIPWQSEMRITAPVEQGLYSDETIARGRQLAAAGNCAACHTTRHGHENAGGLAIETPFGIIHSTNLTPDLETGIGGWSYAAFERAMRDGVSRDGRHLYPVFPYPSFRQMANVDLQALYAYLMAQPPVRAATPDNLLRFPFGFRPLLAGWKLLFLRGTAFAEDATRSQRWRRGEYLVEAVAHCGGCHSPRGALGVEKSGKAWMSGGSVDGWEAPPLAGLSHAPIAWTESDLYEYLRTGADSHHGAVSGPMSQVIDGLSALPDDDIRAIAHYLASRLPAVSAMPVRDALKERLQQAAQLASMSLASSTARLFDSGCGGCHGAAYSAHIGTASPLELSSSVHSDRPDNVVRAIMEGTMSPRSLGNRNMPSFRDILTDGQVADLARYIRLTRAPDKPMWGNIEPVVAASRSSDSWH